MKTNCAVGRAAFKAAITARAWRPSPTDGACTQTVGRPRSRVDLPHAMSLSCAASRPRIPTANFDDPDRNKGVPLRRTAKAAE